MFHTMPVARSMPTSSSGELIAATAASRARPRPLPRPMPISDDPAFAITDRTSAKSTFTSPGTCRRNGHRKLRRVAARRGGGGGGAP